VLRLLVPPTSVWSNKVLVSFKLVGGCHNDFFGIAHTTPVPYQVEGQIYINNHLHANSGVSQKLTACNK